MTSTTLPRATGGGAFGLSKVSDKYQPAKFPDDVAGTFFSGVFSDNVVLQREPARAAVYGVVIGAELDTTVAVKISEVSGSTAASIAAEVVVTTQETEVGGLYATWRAVLEPAAAGGNYTISASCMSCAAPSNFNTLNSVTFGEVWFCSGQSNMWLPMHMDTSRNRTYDAILNEGRYTNIRMFSVPHNNQPDGGFEGTDLYILRPPPVRNA